MSETCVTDSDSDDDDDLELLAVHPASSFNGKLHTAFIKVKEYV